jgi:hypothetical protein
MTVHREVRYGNANSSGHTCKIVSYVINIVFLLNVLATLVAIPREVHYEKRIYLDKSIQIYLDISILCIDISTYIHSLY